MKYSFLIIAALYFLNSSAQTVKKATRQSWAGGVCCISGINFNVYLDTKLSPEKISIHQIWLKNHGLIQGSISSFINEKNTIVVSFGYRKNNLLDPVDDVKIINKKDEMPQFDGMALIILNHRNKKVKIEVSGFEDLKMVAYP